MKTKVLVVDDSPYTRQIIKKILEQDASLDVIGVASDGVDAMAKTLRLRPDIITLDFEMPQMDGFSFLRWLMKERPTPVIMVSSFGDSKTVFRALELGAVDFISKPTRRASIELQTIEKDLLRKVKGIKDIRLDILSRNLELLDKDEVIDVDEEEGPKSIQIVAIGSSTGGPAALQIILTRMPADFQAGIVISQHMPRGFTNSLAERLDRLSPIRIKEAEHGDLVEKGAAYICPGGNHMSLQKKGGKVTISLREGKITDKYTPSVDFMMQSVADVFGKKTLGVILTGMGNDGREGMLEIKSKGGYTIAESEESAVVFGMPAEAIKTGAVDVVVPISEMPAEVIRMVNSPNQKRRS